MGNWDSCISRNSDTNKNNDCFSFAYYNDQNAVFSECEGTMKVRPEEYATTDDDKAVMTLQCGQDSFEVFSPDGLTKIKISDSIFNVPSSGKEQIAVLGVQVKTKFTITDTPTTLSSDVIGKVRLLQNWKPKGADTQAFSAGNVLVDRFPNIEECEEWIKSFGNNEVESSKYYITSADVTDQDFFIDLKSKDKLQKVLNSGEVFILNPHGTEPFVSIIGEEILKKLSAQSVERMTLIYIANGKRPQLLLGKASDLSAYVTELTKRQKHTPSNTQLSPPKWDLGVKISAPQGFGNDKNYIQDSTVYNDWLQDDPKAMADYQNAQTNERSRYYTPATGLVVSAHYLWTPEDWFQGAFGLQDEMAFRFGPEETANSWLFGNFVGLDVGLRFGHFMKGYNWYLALEPLAFGYFVATGETTLKDTPVKEDITIQALAYRPGASLGLQLSRKVFLEAGYAYQMFLADSIPLQNEHVVQLGLRFFFGRTEEDRSIRVEAEKAPAPIKRTLATKIEPMKSLVAPIYQEVDVPKFKFEPIQSDTLFRAGYSTLKEKGEKKAQELAEKVLKLRGNLETVGFDLPSITFTLKVTAYADSQGGLEDNQTLAQARSESFLTKTMTGLSGLGIGEEAKGMGEDKPILYKCSANNKNKCEFADVVDTNLVADKDLAKLAGNDLTIDNKKTFFYKKDDLLVPLSDYRYKLTARGRALGCERGEKDCNKVARFGQISLDLDDSVRGKEKYLEDMRKSRRLEAVLEYQVPKIDGISASEPSDIVKEGHSTYLPLPPQLPGRVSNQSLAQLRLPELKWVVEQYSSSSEMIISVNLRPGTRDADIIGKYIGFIAQKYAGDNINVRVVVSTDERLDKDYVIISGTQTLEVKPMESSGDYLRKEWFEILKKQCPKCFK